VLVLASISCLQKLLHVLRLTSTQRKGGLGHILDASHQTGLGEIWTGNSQFLIIFPLLLYLEGVTCLGLFLP